MHADGQQRAPTRDDNYTKMARMEVPVKEMARPQQQLRRCSERCGCTRSHRRRTDEPLAGQARRATLLCVLPPPAGAQSKRGCGCCCRHIE